MSKLPSLIRLFLERFLPLALFILITALILLQLEQHSHLQLLRDTGLLTPAQTERLPQLVAVLDRHQQQSAWTVILIATTVALFVAWYGARLQLRRLQTEELNRLQLHKIELLLNSTLEGIYAVDREDRCIMANRACAQLLGYADPAELLGRQMHPLIHHTRPDTTPYPTHDCPIHQTLTTGATQRVEDELLWRKDGSPLPVSYTCRPIMEEGRIIGAISTFFDITDRRRLEEELRHAQKMEAIGQLASGVAHDFNNIMQVISGNAQLVQMMSATPNEQLNSRLAEIVKAVERGVNLTHSMLAFARRQAILPHPLDLNDLVRETAPLARNLLQKPMQLALQLDQSPLPVTADATLIQQVLFNLVTNARDAMPDGGVITIGTEMVEQASIPDGLSAADGPYAVLWVRDTGQGITDEIRHRIFEPFFTTKEVGRGTGLGLSMIYGTIRQHNGFVRIESEPAQGSLVSIYLPSRPNGPVPTAATVKETQDGTHSGN